MESYYFVKQRKNNKQISNMNPVSQTNKPKKIYTRLHVHYTLLRVLTSLISFYTVHLSQMHCIISRGGGD